VRNHSKKVVLMDTSEEWYFMDYIKYEFKIRHSKFRNIDVVRE